ncbi:DUF3211 domain-containing protein [Acidianus sp. HS-5]|uniref:DUF3211 domain-containing protein n=1 Tax=Acidianus sp. HS-5 TaxID=2886040 RepID=UPI001F1CD0C2|nr:DUF3211 domain-containing protein [Acidianus sp. HS-5]
MKYKFEINTLHSVESLRLLLSDPAFLFPKIFRDIKEIKVGRSSFYGNAKYMWIYHDFNGNVYSSLDEISYVFTLRHGKDSGIGKIILLLEPNKVTLSIEYEGWMERLASSALKSWTNEFIKNFEEDVRIERIKRKI